MSASEPTQENALERQLKERIGRDGPISVAAYMDACLNDPLLGYYRRQMAIGAAGDFVTAPEISQVFGELIGLWCAVVWQQMGEPNPVRLIELGPGRGTLMRDALRAARLVPAFRAAMRVELVESNATLEAVQRATLGGESVPLSWSSELKADAGPVIVIANEFLDTLPVAQWVWREGMWRTRSVGLGEAGALAFIETEPHACGKLAAMVGTPREGDVYETRAAAFERLADQLASLGAPFAALLIDYGHGQPGFGDTLQAVRGHRYADPLAAPGESDLTAQVDFADLAKAMRRAGLGCDGPLPQGEFLGRLGIIERASRLMAANRERAGELEAGVARLMAPAGMGGRFQVLGVRSRALASLPGLVGVDSAQRTP